jgi:hypothetical protein
MRMVACSERRHTRMWRGCALGNIQEQKAAIIDAEALLSKTPDVLILDEMVCRRCG